MQRLVQWIRVVELRQTDRKAGNRIEMIFAIQIKGLDQHDTRIQMTERRKREKVARHEDEGIDQQTPR